MESMDTCLVSVSTPTTMITSVFCALRFVVESSPISRMLIMPSDMATVGRGVGVNRGVGVRVGLGVGVMVMVGVIDGAAVWAGAAWVRTAVDVGLGEAVGVRVEVGERLAVGEGDDVVVGVGVLLFEFDVSATGTVGNASTLGEGLAAGLPAPAAGLPAPAGSTATSSVAGGVPQAASMFRISTTAKTPAEARESGLCVAEPVERCVILASVVLS
jgi:hypothetical protein